MIVINLNSWNYFYETNPAIAFNAKDEKK